MYKTIPKKPALVYNSIEHQAKNTANSLTIGEWNRVVNILKQQSNLNTKYLEDLHRVLFYDWNSDDSGYAVGGVLPIFYEDPEGANVLTVLQSQIDSIVKDIDALEEIDLSELERTLNDRIDQVDIMIGVVTVMETELPLNGFKTIDGIIVKKRDRVLVTGLGKEYNGIYEVNEDGTWKFLQEVKPNQVVSIELGHEHGGSLQKKEHNGVTVVVKKPERSQWRVLI